MCMYIYLNNKQIVALANKDIAVCICCRAAALTPSMDSRNPRLIIRALKQRSTRAFQLQENLRLTLRICLAMATRNASTLKTHSVPRRKVAVIV